MYYTCKVTLREENNPVYTLIKFIINKVHLHFVSQAILLKLRECGTEHRFKLPDDLKLKYFLVCLDKGIYSPLPNIIGLAYRADYSVSDVTRKPCHMRLAL